jgi:DNA-binding NarL/FixJ family response regulator
MPNPKILVVEDFEKFRDFVVSALRENAQFEVTEAIEGLEAVQKAEEQKPDLILLDIGLPDVDGLEVARRVLKLPSPPKILFVSQETSRQVVCGAISLGARGYIQKSRAGRDLLPGIRAALDGRRFVSPGLVFRDSAAAQGDQRHEMFCYSDHAALVSGLADFIADSLNSGNAALVRTTIRRRDSLHAELQLRGVDLNAAIQGGTYAFWNIDEPPDPTRMPDTVRRLSEATSKAGNKNPRVAVCSESTGRLWAEGKIDEAVQLEQRANELAKHHDIDILCPYHLPDDREHHPGFKNVCTEHSAVCFR